MKQRKLLVCLAIPALVLLIIVLWYPYQKSSAVHYLIKQSCNSSDYVAIGGDEPCSSGSGITVNRWLLGVGVHYSYQTIGGSNGLSQGIYPGCSGGLPPTYSGNAVSILGLHLVFGTAITQNKLTHAPAC